VVLSKRERYIAILTCSVLVVLGLYQFVLQPLLDQRDDLDVQIARATTELSGYNKTIRQSRDARKDLTAMTTGGKIGRDASDAETIYRNVRDWASEAGMTPPSVQPTRTPEKEKDFYKLTFRAQGAGSMSQIARFLYKIRTANVPVEINELLISSNKENTDDLKLALTMATIYLAPDNDRQQGSKAPVAPSASAGEVDQ
jgi:hypothetical protein